MRESECNRRCAHFSRLSVRPLMKASRCKRWRSCVICCAELESRTVISVFQVPKWEWCVNNTRKKAKLRDIRRLNIVKEMRKDKVEEIRGQRAALSYVAGLRGDFRTEAGVSNDETWRRVKREREWSGQTQEELQSVREKTRWPRT